jgi:glycosyltransferase involved in cell wall biosynthesis
MGFLPSRFRGESFPLVIIDCFHSGRPVLASDIGEIGRMIMTPDGPAGMLFSLDKWKIPVPEVARLIAACAQDRDMYMTCLSRVSAAAAKFDAAELLKNYDSVYMELFRGNNG